MPSIRGPIPGGTESRCGEIADVFQPGGDRAVGPVEFLSEDRLARPVENLEISNAWPLNVACHRA